MTENAVVGGTFNILHRGHSALFERARETADGLLVGLTSDSMAVSTKTDVRLFAVRRRELEEYLSSLGMPFEIVQIDDAIGPAGTRDDINCIVVSEETKGNVAAINNEREKNGLAPLRIEVVPTVFAEDFLPISSTRILSAEIDIEGRLLVPLRVHVGSTNRVKIDAVARVLKPLYGLLEVEGMDVLPGVAEQPRGEEVIRGAINRAKSSIGDAHLGVGIEAGLFWNKTIDWYFDVQVCAVVDATGRITVGHGPGFCYPPAVIERVEKGQSVDQAMFELTGIELIGHKMGSVGYLSRELLTRGKLTEMAIIAALIPRIRPELYHEIWRMI